MATKKAFKGMSWKVSSNLPILCASRMATVAAEDKYFQHWLKGVGITSVSQSIKDQLLKDQLLANAALGVSDHLRGRIPFTTMPKEDTFKMALRYICSAWGECHGTDAPAIRHMICDHLNAMLDLYKNSPEVYVELMRRTFPEDYEEEYEEETESDSAQDAHIPNGSLHL